MRNLILRCCLSFSYNARLASDDRCFGFLSTASIIFADPPRYRLTEMTMSNIASRRCYQRYVIAENQRLKPEARDCEHPVLLKSVVDLDFRVEFFRKIMKIENVYAD